MQFCCTASPEYFFNAKTLNMNSFRNHGPCIFQTKEERDHPACSKSLHLWLYGGALVPMELKSPSMLKDKQVSEQHLPPSLNCSTATCCQLSSCGSTWCTSFTDSKQRHEKIVPLCCVWIINTPQGHWTKLLLWVQTLLFSLTYLSLFWLPPTSVDW